MDGIVTTLSLEELAMKDEPMQFLTDNKSRCLLEFGEFEGKKLSWIVYDINKSSKHVSVISKHALKKAKYNDSEYLCAWECTKLFAWLNGEFYKKSIESFSSLSDMVVVKKKTFCIENVFTQVSCSEIIRILTYDELEMLPEEEKICFCCDNPTEKVFWWMKKDLITGENAVNLQGNTIKKYFTDRDCYVRPALTLDLNKLKQ